MSKTMDQIRIATRTAELANVPLQLKADEAKMLLGRHDNLIIHLVKVMAVASENLDYAPSSDKALAQMDTMFAARDYLIEQEIITADMIEKLR